MYTDEGLDDLARMADFLKQVLIDERYDLGRGADLMEEMRDLRARMEVRESYLEARWASLVPYAAAAELLADVLPIAAGANASTVRRHVMKVAERLEGDLPADRCTFMDGAPRDWADLPIPDGRVVVGLDGGYVRDWNERKNNFEVIVGRSMPRDGPSRYLGFVHGHDRKPKRRLMDLLESQGVQTNQDITVLTDGGKEILALTEQIRMDPQRRALAHANPNTNPGRGPPVDLREVVSGDGK